MIALGSPRRQTLALLTSLSLGNGGIVKPVGARSPNPDQSSVEDDEDDLIILLGGQISSPTSLGRDASRVRRGTVSDSGLLPVPETKNGLGLDLSDDASSLNDETVDSDNLSYPYIGHIPSIFRTGLRNAPEHMS